MTWIAIFGGFYFFVGLILFSHGIADLKRADIFRHNARVYRHNRWFGWKQVIGGTIVALLGFCGFCFGTGMVKEVNWMREVVSFIDLHFIAVLIAGLTVVFVGLAIEDRMVK